MGGLPMQAHTFPRLLSSTRRAPLRAGLPDPPRALLPEEEVPGPAQRVKGSREYWGIVWPGPLGCHKAAEEEVLFLSCWASWALGLSVLPSTLPASPQGGQWPASPARASREASTRQVQ